MIPRARTLLTPTYASILPGQRAALSLASQRSYTVSSYGGENQTINKKSPSLRTREIEHPGPPSSNTPKNSPSPGARASTASSSASSSQYGSSQPGPAQGHPITAEPSNHAHPTLTDGRQSPYVDDQGHLNSDAVPQDVRRHNAEMEDRYDRSYNQIADEGNVHQGFWNRWKKK